MTPPPDDTFAPRLRALAAAAGLSASELARRAGLSRQAVSCYLAGSREPHLAALRSLCRALGVGLGAFDDPPAPTS